MNMNDEEYKLIKAEKEKEAEENMRFDSIMYFIYPLIVPLIFFGLKYVYSLLH